MSKEVCEAIKGIDENVVFDPVSQKYAFTDEIYGVYCSPTRKGEKGQCDSNGKLLGSAFIALLNIFDSFGDEEEKLENNKLGEYAILWLSYKLYQYKERSIEVDDVYDILTGNDWFQEHYKSIEEKKDMMKFHLIYLNNLYTLLKEICNTITNCSDSSNSSECQESAKKCAASYRSCMISFPWTEICDPYCRILSNLKNDYDKIRGNNSKLPELKPPEGRKSCEIFCEEKKQKLKAEKAKVEVSEMNIRTEGSLSSQSSTKLSDSLGNTLPVKEVQMDESSSVTLPTVSLTSINNTNKLPYIAIPFFLIPVILGISYKYLTHGQRKKSNGKKKVKTIINLCDANKIQKDVTNGFVENI
ncbi:CIR protein [Plasmodium chabaudi chabaudi]|uniref:CIR protein n=1 Tax=Plasmodium chabaudi chabaudi TaxID=31271 RepID=A0A4V0K4S9_PLACU|nr:CIR protein [Plasmodium chabaudi chabaudi]VTZ67879.1 CIR protein [Plasmodium chabaudi chabaudi]|eukprot:XP_016653508.1 CIR protein [Plasmodium chabaudi chabaudi]